MKKALLIIDLLQDFFKEGRLAEHRQKLATNVNELVDVAHKQNVPVIWVRQEFKADLSDAPLYNRKYNKPTTIEGTDGCKLLPELHRADGDSEIVKKRYSVFFNTDLDKLLEQLNIEPYLKDPEKYFHFQPVMVINVFEICFLIVTVWAIVLSKFLRKMEEAKFKMTKLQLEQEIEVLSF